MRTCGGGGGGGSRDVRLVQSLGVAFELVGKGGVGFGMRFLQLLEDEDLFVVDYFRWGLFLVVFQLVFSVSLFLFLVVVVVVLFVVVLLRAGALVLERSSACAEVDNVVA